MPRTRDGPRTAINHIVVSGYEKRRTPSKHYVYVVDVTWDNDERYEVLRRYSEFFTLQETLKLVFPERVNRYTDKQYSLPPLPSRKFIGRSHIKSVAEARLEAINKYCQLLVSLDEKISRSSHVLTFLSPKFGDRKQPKLRLQRPATLYPQIRPAGNNVWEEYCVIAAFKGESPSQISAESGDQVILLNKDPSGWWLVERRGKIGWIPSSYLKKTKVDDDEDYDTSPYLGLVGAGAADQKGTGSDGQLSLSPTSMEIEAQEYVAIDSYEAQETGQLSFEEGEVITVLDKMEDGWWFVSRDEQEEGWVPCGYLEPLHNNDEENPISTLDIEKYQTLAPYSAEEDDEISFPALVVAEVLQKSLTGWWLIRCDGNVGLAPATYLKKIYTEADELSSNDSGIESSLEKQEYLTSSFKQVPRRRTIHKRKSTKKENNKPHTETILEDKEDTSRESTPISRGTSSSRDSTPISRGTPSSQDMTSFSRGSPVKSKIQPINVESEQRMQGQERKSSDPTSRTKPIPLPRKNSQPESKTILSTSPKPPPVSPKPVRLVAPYTPPRPRQSQINRAWSDTKQFSPPGDDELDEMSSESSKKRGFSPSRILGRRSPSPRSSPINITPKTSPFAGRRGTPKSDSLSPPLLNESQPSDNGYQSDEVGAGSSTGGGSNPFTQEMVGSMLKYILASKDTSLKETLREIVFSDPQVKDALKE